MRASSGSYMFEGENLGQPGITHPMVGTHARFGPASASGITPWCISHALFGIHVLNMEETIWPSSVASCLSVLLISTAVNPYFLICYLQDILFYPNTKKYFLDFLDTFCMKK